MSIVLLVRSLNVGGAERQLVNLAKGLHAMGVRVTVVMFYDGGELLGELQGAGVHVTGLGKRGRWDTFGFFGRLARALRRERPNVIYSFLVEPNIIAVLMKAFLPGTKIVWGVRASNMERGMYDWPTRVSFLISRWLAPFADLIIANSWSGAEYHVHEGYPRGRTVVVPNGFDVERFQPDAEAGRRTRAEWGIGDGVELMGMVGRLDPIKDYATCLEAFALVRRDRPRLRLVSVGDGATEYGAELRIRAEALGIADAVLWAGPQRDMKSVYNALDVLCSSSLSEGFPNVLGEAMACGVPCVATAVGDSARILDTCGVVVPPENAGRLADGVREVLARGRAEGRQACRERIVREFTLDRMVRETEGLLRACVGAVA